MENFGFKFIEGENFFFVFVIFFFVVIGILAGVNILGDFKVRFAFGVGMLSYVIVIYCNFF